MKYILYKQSQHLTPWEVGNAIFTDNGYCLTSIPLPRPACLACSGRARAARRTAPRAASGRSRAGCRACSAPCCAACGRRRRSA